MTDSHILHLDNDLDGADAVLLDCAMLGPPICHLLHVVAVIVYVQIAIPKPLYLVYRLGEWVTTPPRPVDLEVVPFMPAFKPSTLSPADMLFI